MVTRICTKCYSARLDSHPELMWWFKCPICAFCEYNLEYLSPSERERAESNKFAKHPLIAALEVKLSDNYELVPNPLKK